MNEVRLCLAFTMTYISQLLVYFVMAVHSLCVWSRKDAKTSSSRQKGPTVSRTALRYFLRTLSKKSDDVHPPEFNGAGVQRDPEEHSCRGPTLPHCPNPAPLLAPHKPALPTTAPAFPLTNPSKTQQCPIVLVHGMLGFGEFDATRVPEGTHVAPIGPFSSSHDRACEVYSFLFCFFFVVYRCTFTFFKVL